jgi:hypothetical protein
MKRLRRAVFLLASATVVGGCDKSTDPRPVYELSGVYDLTTVSGSSLPHEYACNQSSPFIICTLHSGYIAVVSDDILEVSTTLEWGSSSEPQELTSQYSYTRFGNRATLTSVPDAQVHESFVIQVGEGTITKGENLYVRRTP